MWLSHQCQSPTMPTGLWGNMGNQLQYSFHLCFVFGRPRKVIEINGCSSSNEADMLVFFLFDRCLAQITLVSGRYRKAIYGQYKVTANDWNYDASCTLTSFPVWDSCCRVYVTVRFTRLIYISVTFQTECTQFVHSKKYQDMWVMLWTLVLCFNIILTRSIYGKKNFLDCQN
jgi:hypothetical protein